MNMLGLLSSICITHIACYWTFLLLHYTQVFCQCRLCKADPAYLTCICYNDSIITWMILSLTTTKFKPLIFLPILALIVLIIPLHRPSEKHRFQQYLYCCMCIHCCGNVFTKLLLRNSSKRYNMIWLCFIIMRVSQKVTTKYFLKWTQQQYIPHRYISFQHSPPAFQHTWSSIAQT
jgi:hypothetical protein